MITSEEYDRRCAESEAALRPKLTPGFLEVLREAVRVCGHAVDMIETVSFAEWCYSVAGAEAPDDLGVEMNPVGDVKH